MQQSSSETLDWLVQQVLQIQQQKAEDRAVLKNLEKIVTIMQNQLLAKGFPNASKSKRVDDKSYLLKKAKQFLQKNHLETLSRQLAHDVSSVVGLKEAITWKSKFLKCIWTIALCAGVAATAFFVYKSCDEYVSNPTATRVEMVSKAKYPYPSILLCPNVWLDAEKALTLGLSLEGLKYSLGYVNYYNDKVGPGNASIAQDEFFNFFDKSNYSSFDDYLVDISHDIPMESSEEKYDNTYYSSAYCPRCDDSFLKTVVTSNGVCYNFKLQPENGRGRLSSITRMIGLQLRDRSLELVNTSLWGLYVGIKETQLASKNFNAPQIIIKEFTATKVRFTEHQFYMHNNVETPCLLKETYEVNYTSTICITKCLSPIYNQILNCTPFESVVGKWENHPSELCNTFDATFQESLKHRVQDLVLSSDAAKRCYKNCPYTCDRVRYETTYEGGFSSNEHSVAWADMAKQALSRNTVFADILIENAALYQGGVLTLWEIDTISFIELISNVGGTLGLFVGCTMMTFVQIVLFVIKFFTEKCNRVNASTDIS